MTLPFGYNTVNGRERMKMHLGALSVSILKGMDLSVSSSCVFPSWKRANRVAAGRKLGVLETGRVAVKKEAQPVVGIELWLCIPSHYMK
jgi:hypothetical protein